MLHRFSFLLRLALTGLIAANLSHVANAASAASGASAADRGELVFLTWADYIDPEVVAEFEREAGVQVRFSFYESDDGRDEIMANTDGRGFDVAVVAGLQVEAYAKRGWLAPLDGAKIPNRSHIAARWGAAFPGTGRYAVPYFWGTLGVAYRRDKVTREIRSWRDFFEPEEALRGRITMLRSSRDVLGMALKSLGHSANSSDREAIHAAGRLLVAQRPFVRSYEYVSLSEESPLVTGEVWASLMYSGDALMVGEYDERIAYVVPEEGGNIWGDYLAIVSSSPRQALAARFIDFLNRPEIAARNAEYVNYATPNHAAHEFLGENYFSNEIIHPGKSVLVRSEVYRTLPPRAQRTVNSVFADLVN